MQPGVMPKLIPARILNKHFYCTSSLPVLYTERGQGHRLATPKYQFARTASLEEEI